MSKDTDYELYNATMDLIQVVDGLLAILTKQKLSTEDFEAAKMQFNKFSSIQYKLSNNPNIPYHTNDN